MADDIVALLRAPELCICVDAVLANCSPCNARIQAADEIERLRSMIETLTRNSLTHLSIGLTRESGRHAE